MIQILAVSLIVIVIAVWVVRRLLGTRSGRWGQTALAVILGEAATIGILQLVTGHVLALSWGYVPLGVVLVVLLSMLALALVEALTGTPQGDRIIRLPRPLRAIRRRIDVIGRTFQVAVIAVRSGLLRALREDAQLNGGPLGRALATTFEEAGGLFVKLGQVMASQPKLVSPSVAVELMRLQEDAAPADPAEVMTVLEEELGSPADVFADFTIEPIGTASIAQTYFATLHDGRAVVVKVQRPGVRRAMERDLVLLEGLGTRLERRAAWARTLGLRELIGGFADATREELDFRIEAVNGGELRNSVTEQDPIAVPRIVGEFTTERVLVEERVDGRGVGSPGALDAVPIAERRVLADGLLVFLARQMLDGARYHADPHPGNVFMQADGRLALIDFGSVGRLNSFERTGLLDLFRALVDEDAALMRQAALRLGTAGPRIDTEALDRELATMLSRAVLPGDRLDPAVLGDVLVVFRDFGIRLPRTIPALFRTLLTLMGTLEILVPGYDLVGGVRRMGGPAMNPLRQHKTVKEFVQHEALSLAPVLRRLPGDLDDVARSLVRGDLRVRVSLLSEPEDVRTLWSMLNRVLLGLIAAGLALPSALLLIAPAGGEQGSLLHLVGAIGLSVAGLLLFRLLVQVLRDTA